MPLFDAPKAFVQRLRAYDNMLRIRWSDFERRWRIERKIAHARSIDPGLYKESDYEQFVARREGYLPILFCQREQLDNRILYTLWASDMQRQGGGAKVADRLTAYEEAFRLHKRAKWLDDVYNQAKDYYNWMNTLTSTQRSLGKQLDVA